VINDDTNSLKGAERGPSLLEDFHLCEKTTHFDHERIPERVVHAVACDGLLRVALQMLGMGVRGAVIDIVVSPGHRPRNPRRSDATGSAVPA
jgi:hypothetical protein